MISWAGNCMPLFYDVPSPLNTVMAPLRQHIEDGLKPLRRYREGSFNRLILILI